MTTATRIRACKWITGLLIGVALTTPDQALAGKGASYQSIANAIATGNRDSIVSEIERSETLPCAPCIDLVKPLIDHDDAAVRDVAAWWLGGRAVRDKIRDEMYARLSGTDSVKARNAAEVLGRFGHPAALMPLEIAIHDDTLSEEARAASATAVGRIGDYRGKAVLEAAMTSESAAVRQAAAKGAREIRGNLEGVALLELLHDDDEAVVREAALSVGAVRELSGVADLIDVVSDVNLSATTRKHAAWALGKLGDGNARDALRSIVEGDRDMIVRGAARAALNTLR